MSRLRTTRSAITVPNRPTPATPTTYRRRSPILRPLIRTSARRSLLIHGAGVVTRKELPRGHRGLNRRNPRCGETRTINGESHVRRITLLVLAASAGLIVTQASADPECFTKPAGCPSWSTRLPRRPPDANDAATVEASAAASKIIPAKALPQGGGRAGDAAACADAKPR